jgi:hypothetical protein
MKQAVLLLQFNASVYPEGRRTLLYDIILLNT